MAISNCLKECSQITKFSPARRFGLILLPPANEGCEGYVFTHVCQSFCSQGVYTPLGRHPWTDTPPLDRHSTHGVGRQPPGRQPLPGQTPPADFLCKWVCTLFCLINGQKLLKYEHLYSLPCNQPIFIGENKSQNLVTCEYSRSLYSQNRIYSFE